MAENKKVFIVGPGFIGLNILDLLVKEHYNVTGLVRRQEHEEQLRSLGAYSVKGNLDDKSLITDQVVQHDIIFHTATADHLPSAEAILDGIKQRAVKGLSTVYIHTSGTSVLYDGVPGSAKTSEIFYDNDRSKIDGVPDNAPHRQIDLAILKAQEELGDKAKIAIMVPPLIYGFNPAHQRLTIQIPTLTRFALKHGFAGEIGNGAPVTSNIHVLDLSRAYIVLLHHMESAPASTLLSNPYYFCETTGDDEPSWHDMATVIGQSLHQAGKLSDPVPRTIPEDLYGDLFGEFTNPVVGLNCRSRAVRLRELGWKPTEKDWKRSFVEDELPEILREKTGSFSGYKGVAAS